VSNKHIIILSGKKQVGKSSIAEFLCEKYQYEEFTLAYSLKKGIKDITMIDNDCNNKDVTMFNNRTIRSIYQDFCDYCKTNFGENIFVINLLNRILTSNSTNIVISDMRFEHEYSILKTIGKVIKITRTTGYNDSHISEQGINDKNITTIINNKSLNELFIKITNLLTNL